MVLSRVASRLYRVQLGAFQAYLWRDADAVTIIDTGPSGSGPEIIAAIGELGLTPMDVRFIVLTHFHDDHAGAAHALRAWTGAPVVAHRLDAPAIRGDVAGPEPCFTDAERLLHAQVAAGLPPAPASPVDVEVVGGEVLDVGGGAELISTPGHTDGSVAVHLRQQGVLFTGDIVAEHQGAIVPGVFNMELRRDARVLPGAGRPRRRGGLLRPRGTPGRRRRRPLAQSRGRPPR